MDCDKGNDCWWPNECNEFELMLALSPTAALFLVVVHVHIVVPINSKEPSQTIPTHFSVLLIHRN